MLLVGHAMVRFAHDRLLDLISFIRKPSLKSGEDMIRCNFLVWNELSDCSRGGHEWSIFV